MLLAGGLAAFGGAAAAGDGDRLRLGEPGVARGLAIALLALLLIGKVVGDLRGIGLGVPGGMIGPSLFIGAMLGALVAEVAAGCCRPAATGSDSCPGGYGGDDVWQPAGAARGTDGDAGTDRSTGDHSAGHAGRGDSRASPRARCSARIPCS